MAVGIDMSGSRWDSAGRRSTDWWAGVLDEVAEAWRMESASETTTTASGRTARKEDETGENGAATRLGK